MTVADLSKFYCTPVDLLYTCIQCNIIFLFIVVVLIFISAETDRQSQGVTV